MAGLDEHQREWLGGGLAGAAATVGDQSQTTVVRVFAQRSSEGGTFLDFCIARSDAERTLQNLEHRPLAAVNLVCPRTYRSLLFKGPCARLDEPFPDDLLQQCLQRSNEALVHVGMPANTAHRFLSHYDNPSMVTLRLRVEEVFDQSPGPRAGTKL